MAVPYVLAQMGSDGRPHPVDAPAVFMLNPTALTGARLPDPLTERRLDADHGRTGRQGSDCGTC